MQPNNGSEYIVAAYKSLPPTTVAVVSLGGVTLNQWVLISTLIYTLLQTGYFIYDKFLRKKV